MNEQPLSLEAIRERLTYNLAGARAAIAETCAQAGRGSNEVTLVAVSKTLSVEFVQVAHSLGVNDFGENRVQEALPKIEAFHPEGLRWHMIGRLQSNKAGKVVGAFDTVQSVDSLHLARVLDRQAEIRERTLPILLEINVAGEESKGGVALSEAGELARQVAALPRLEIQGLMTVAPLTEDPEEVRPVFRRLRKLLAQLREAIPGQPWRHLSMGMTDDFRVAIEEGATIVRIGRAIFGERPPIQKGT